MRLLVYRHSLVECLQMIKIICTHRFTLQLLCTQCQEVYTHAHRFTVTVAVVIKRNHIICILTAFHVCLNKTVLQDEC